MPEERAHSSVRLLLVVVLLHFKWFFAHFYISKQINTA